MKFADLLFNLITENARLEFLYDKYANKSEDDDVKGSLIPLRLFKEIIKSDPTSKIPKEYDLNNASFEDFKDKVDAGKYCEWIIQNIKYLQSVEKIPRKELLDLNKKLKKYELILTRAKNHIPERFKNIKNLSISELNDFLENLELPVQVKQKLGLIEDNKELFNYPGSEIICQGPNYTVVKISDKGRLGAEAASYFGGYYKFDKGETTWCTSPENSIAVKGYISQGPLYVILANDDMGFVGEITGLPTERYQWHFESNSFMDRNDKQMDLVKFLTGKGAELMDCLPQIKKVLEKKVLSFLGGIYDGRNMITKTFDYDGYNMPILDFLSGSEVRFLDYLPSGLSKIKIVGKKNIYDGLTPMVANMTSLTYLRLDNCVSSIPGSIVMCDKLKYLYLENNPELTSLPISLSNLPELEIISLYNTPATIPNSLKDKFVDIRGNNVWYRI